MGEPIELNYQDLEIFTDDFSDDNFIYHSLYCKVYRGKIPQGWRDWEKVQEITVKVWTEEAFVIDDRHRLRTWDENLDQFENEIKFLKHQTAVPNLPNLMGFCRDEATMQLGVVFDLKSWHVLEYLCDKEQFNWPERIKVALGLAKLLEHLHDNDPPYAIRDFWTTNIMIDQDSNPVLFNSIGITGGILGDRTNERDFFYIGNHGSHRYIDPKICNISIWDEVLDIYAFGMMLFELIRKRKVSTCERKLASFNNMHNLLALYQRRKSKFTFGATRRSIVDPIFEVETGFRFRDARALSGLAFHCVMDDRGTRPTAKKVVETLESLQILKKPLPGKKPASLILK